MPDPTDRIPPTEVDEELLALAQTCAAKASSFIAGVETVASGRDPGSAIAILLLELSGVLMLGARLGAQEDFVPEGRWEPDVGMEPEIDQLRLALREQLADVDEYREVFDPYVPDTVVQARLSDDLAGIVSDLLHGLAHHAAGRPLEALFWLQYTYLSSWGPAAGSALRAVQSLVAHVRTGAPISEPATGAIGEVAPDLGAG